MGKLTKILDLYDIYYLRQSKKNEIKKFQDPRRVKIYSSFELTKAQKKEIDDLYVNNYGEKIPYTWHKHFSAFTGKFDKYYFPELLFIPEFEYFMNKSANNVHKTFEDKNIIPMFANFTDCKIPQTLFSSSLGVIQDANHNIVSKGFIQKNLQGECFIKPSVDTCSGVGCQVLDVENGIDKLSGATLESILTEKGQNWVIQERLKCHKSISDVYANSVNTFRILTYIWKDEICNVPVIMRIGQGGGNLDNAHAGGMFIAISDEGVLHKTAFTEFNQSFKEHPDTKIKFEGYKIDLFPKVLEKAKQMHSLIPQIGCISWDFTLTKDGEPCLIEMNTSGGSIWFFQMAHGCGPFGNKTPEILRWMKLMKSLKKSQRSKYLYGKMDSDF